MSASETISDFRVEVTDSVLADLERRLRATRWPEPSPGAGWDYGMDLGYLRELTSSWIGFDWRTAEDEINRLPQFECLVGLERIHFVHLCGKGPALPIILTHGWPASFLEFRHIIEPLADPGAHGGDPDDAFDVVVPSLPGYAFSPPPVNPATTKKTIAELWRALMVDALGYERFVAHGGDIGCGVTTRLGLHHADVVAAIHLIHLFESPYIGPGTTPLNAAEQAYQEGLEQWAAAEGAYREVQRTKPYTLGPALNDSPSGLAAWIVEKYRNWGDTRGDVESRFPRHELLTTLTLYWATQSITSSVEAYYANRRWHEPFQPGERVAVPTGVSLFPNEYIVEPEPPREWGERLYEIERWRSFPSGGHFPALEEPAVLVEELREFFRAYR